MPAIARLIAFVLSLGFVVAAAGAQQKVLIPERLERATVTDDKGATNWADWKADKCPNCSGTGKVKCTVCERFGDDADKCPDCKRVESRETVCRMCAGTGELPDPLLKVGCPGCTGAAFLLCTVCAGGGRLKINGAKNWSACPACRGDGAWKCGACAGKRLVEPAALKPAMKDASVKDLAKAQAVTDQALKELAALTPTGGQKARKDIKALVKTFDTAGSVFPPLKRLGKPFEDYMGKIAAGSNFQGSEENEAETIAAVKQSAEYYLKHQKRMLELAHKRAEANAALPPEPKK
jgi:hypothetical protein